MALTYQADILVLASSRWFGDMSLECGCLSFQRLKAWTWHDCGYQRAGGEPQDTPATLLHAASRRGESPSCSARSGSVKRISSR